MPLRRLAVSLVNFLLVLLQDALAVELLGRSHETLGDVRRQTEWNHRSVTYVLRCPFLVGEYNSFDDLDSTQTTLLARSLQLFEHGTADLVVVNQFVILSTCTTLLSQGLQRRFVGHNDSDWFGLVLSGIDADIRDNGGRPVDGLELQVGVSIRVLLKPQV